MTAQKRSGKLGRLEEGKNFFFRAKDFPASNLPLFPESS
jgi:hypothetical protein